MSTKLIRYMCKAEIAILGLPFFLIWHLALTKASAQDFWQQTNGPNGGIIRSITVNSQNHIFVGTNIGLFRSTDDGNSWMKMNNGLPLSSVYALAINANGHIFAGTSDGLFRSADNGGNWATVNTGLTNNIVSVFVINATGNIWAGTFGGGIFRSTNNGGNWTSVNIGLTSTYVRALAISENGQIFAGTSDGVFQSTDNGGSWTPVNNGLPRISVYALAINASGQIFAGTGNGIFRSMDNGASWMAVNNGLMNTDVRALVINPANSDIFTGTFGGGIFRLTNDSEIWMAINTGLTSNFVSALAINSSAHVFAGTDDGRGGGFFRSFDNGGTWALIGLPIITVYALAINPTTQDIFAGTDGNGVFSSANNGGTWTPVNNGLTNTSVHALAINRSGHILAGTNGGGIFRSIDNGDIWTQVINISVSALAINASGYIFAGTSGGVFRSTDNGGSWTRSSFSNTNVVALAINSTGDIFAGTDGRGVFRSTNDGDSWVAVSNGLANTSVYALAINAASGYIFAGTHGGGIFRSIDNGDNWTAVNNGLTNIASITVSALAINSIGHIFAGTYYGEGVFYSDNNGDRWITVNSGLTNIDVRALTIDANEHIFAGIDSGGVFISRQQRAILFTPLLSHPIRQQLRVAVRIIGEDAAKSIVVLNYRIGGRTKFDTLQFATKGDSFEVTIPADSVTSRGIEYFITATAVDGNITKAPSSGIYSIQVIVTEGLKKESEQFSGSEQNAYRLISLPLDLNDKSAKAVLEDNLDPYNKKKWRLFALRPDSQAYVEYSDTLQMVPGKAFMLIVKDPGKFIDTGAGTSNRTDKPFSIVLQPRWNFVGNPFNFPIPLANLSVKSGKTFPLRYHEGTWRDPLLNKVSDIKPFEGYAVFNTLDVADTLFINPDLSPSASSLAKGFASTIEEKMQWSIRILAQCQGALDEDTRAAIVSGASSSWDELDQPEPPVIGEYVSVYFPHPEWGKLAKNYCTDVRPVTSDNGLRTSDGGIWEFEVKTNIRDKVNLIFEGIDDVPKALEVWLVDDALQITQNLREQRQYAVAGAGPVAVAGAVAGAGHVKQLKLVVGKHWFVDEKLAEARAIPTTYELFQNFPNPFNPATTIRYGLPKAVRVTLKIYNLLGAEVATLVDNEQKAAGYHAAIWDGRDQNGRVVASGIYLYRMQAGSFVMAKKLALVK